MSKCETIIEYYLELTRDLESPTSFLEWGAISCISAVLRNNVFFKFPNRLETIYPNTYILLVADSAIVRKSPPMNITASLLREINNTKIMAGQASMQGVLKILGNTEQGKPKGGSGIMIAKELDAFFVKDPSTIGLLTNLYDFHPFFDKELSTQDIPPIKDVCLSLFAGSNEIMMRGLFDQTATEGGLLGRCFLIIENQKRLSNSGFEDNAEIIEDEHWNPVRKMLRDISQVKGPLTFEDPARKLYNDWYHSLHQKDLHTKTGYEGRIHTHVLKLATIFAASKPGFRSKNDTPATITVEDVELAINKVGGLLPNYKKITLGTGKSPISIAQGQIATKLLNAKDHHMTYRDILNDLFGDVDKETLEKVMDNLVAADLVVIKSKNGMPGYKATDKLVNLALMNKPTEGKVQ